MAPKTVNSRHFYSIALISRPTCHTDHLILPTLSEKCDGSKWRFRALLGQCQMFEPFGLCGVPRLMPTRFIGTHGSLLNVYWVPAFLVCVCAGVRVSWRVFFSLWI